VAEQIWAGYFLTIHPDSVTAGIVIKSMKRDILFLAFISVIDGAGCSGSSK
jgi:hypothetical protein